MEQLARFAAEQHFELATEQLVELDVEQLVELDAYARSSIMLGWFSNGQAGWRGRGSWWPCRLISMH